jgi:hypothetical protein
MTLRAFHLSFSAACFDSFSRGKGQWKRDLYSVAEDLLLEPVRFIWNATRGYRLTPWRSPYVRWRIETYSGKKAETLTLGSVVSFGWASRWELLSYLGWTGEVGREARRRN